MSVVPVISLVSVGPKSENAEAPPFKFGGYYVLFLAGTSEATIPLKKEFLRKVNLFPPRRDQKHTINPELLL